ncbi:hypothetical protein HCA99_14655 [Listeria booriae]|uniref:ABC-three component system middle component 1 n=1 Tax=Listeria booriae TaxID=1552123 RepID=UPI001629A721|nr:ABC-three component system middle component 1 [Listeria booriae]MBC2080468.1 hypothetical protein [Listeria booriae]
MNNTSFIMNSIQKFDLMDGEWEKFNLEFGEVNVFSAEDSFKRYYFYGINQGSLQDNFCLIDKALEEREIIPQDTYLTMFYKVKEITPEMIKEIIPIEENEFRFKKYVFYYTENEIEKTRDNIDNFFRQNIWTNTDLKDLKNPTSLFLQRLAIKVPIIKLNFEREEVQGYDYFFNKEITGIRKEREMIKVIDKQINELLQQERDMENIIQHIIKDIYGEDIYEYLSK